ncbi:MAG: cation:dicarboxylate symporter family transporter, partial [Candidatus Dadabacteria bacterium]
MRRIFTNLTFWVLTAITCGVILGDVAPATAVKMEPIGKYFIEIVKLFIYPLIFLTITLGISGMGDLKKVGKVGGKAIIYFEVVTTFALLIGIVVAHFIQPGTGVVPHTANADISKYSKGAQEFSWLAFLQHNLTLQVLFVSILVGIVLNLYHGKYKYINWLTIASHYVFKGLKYVMYLAPLGAFGGMAYTIGKYGIKTLYPLAKLMLTVYSTCILFVFVVLGGV